MSPLELDVMNIVWNLKICSVRQVREELNHEKKLAYTTVATILSRLFDKGIVKREEKNLVFFFSPKISRQQYDKKIAGSFFRNFFHSFGDTAIASFAQSIDVLPKAKKEYFLKLLKQK